MKQHIKIAIPYAISIVLLLLYIFNPRTIVAYKYINVVTPEMFGAKGDGISDDTKALQSAIDAAGLAKGGTVLFRAGGKYIADSLILHNKTALVGYGRTTIIKKPTIIKGQRIQNSIDTIIGFESGVWSRGGMLQKPPTDSEYYKGTTIIFNHTLGKTDWGHALVVYPGYAVNDSVARDSFWKGALISADSTNSSKDKVPYLKYKP